MLITFSFEALQDQVFLLTNGLGTCLLTIFVDSATNLPVG